MWSTAIFLLLFISTFLPYKIWQAISKLHPLHVSARKAYFARQALLFFSSCRKEGQNSHNPQPPLCVSNCRSALHRRLNCQRRLGNSRWTFRLCWGNRFGRWCHSQEASHSSTICEVLAVEIDIIFIQVSKSGLERWQLPGSSVRQNPGRCCLPCSHLCWPDTCISHWPYCL